MKSEISQHRRASRHLVRVLLLLGMLLSTELRGGSALADEFIDFTTVDLSSAAKPIPFPEHREFIAALPDGVRSFLSHNLFSISKTVDVVLRGESVSFSTNVLDVRADHLLINTTGATPNREFNEEIGTVLLTFANN